MVNGPLWLEAPMTSLAKAHAAQRMPHALLIHDAPGAGGPWLATWVARLMLCTGAAPRPCGRCRACLQVQEGRHADLLSIGLVDDSQQIRIDQIRELVREFALTSHEGGYKVAILDPADALNPFAANALLKTLEEPTADTMLILVAVQPSRLPATIMSRCQRIRVRPPAREQSLAWLAANRGEADWGAVLDVVGEAPFVAALLDPARVAELRAETLRTLEMARSGEADPASAAERWSRSELQLRLACLENWLTQCIQRSLAPPTVSTEVRSGAHTRAADSVINSRDLFHVLDRVHELKAALNTPMNRSLAIESLLRSLRT
jgi:DNA polymerase-3 subunit delta'